MVNQFEDPKYREGFTEGLATTIHNNIEAAKAIATPPIPPTNDDEDMRPRKSAYGGVSRTFGVMSITGEKDFGEAGPINETYVDHVALRLRSQELFLTSDVFQTIIRRSSTWCIGAGLKLQAEPQKDVLESEGIDMGDVETFNQKVESRFRMYASASTMADFKDEDPLDFLAYQAYLNSLVDGDVLTVLRVVDGVVRVQLIPGGALSTPNTAMPDYQKQWVMENGNRISNGVEIDAKGKHVAYHVRTGILKHERILAREPKTGSRVAYLTYGLEYRLDNTRGIPLLSACIETLKKMDRYKEATIGSAEERQKLAYYIHHTLGSNGTDPRQDQIMKSVVPDFAAANSSFEASEQTARTIATSTNKNTFNMPVGSELKALESRNELHFKDFFSSMFQLVCATVEIPPEVAAMKYDSNFSASRAALKDWEHTNNFRRKKFSRKWYKPIYDLWLTTEVLKSKVRAEGYLEAVFEKNEMALAAYRNARFTGANIPHIDPMKEVQAERLKLGTAAAHLPLTTLEDATEALNGGDYSANVVQFATEFDKANSLGIEDPNKVEEPVEEDKKETGQ